jgi:hypothetical protein
MTSPAAPPPAPWRGAFADAPPPPDGPAAARAAPDQLEGTVRAAMHADRGPGTVVAVCHPLRMYKVPDGLLEALRARGDVVHVVQTLPDRVASVTGIRDALLKAAAEGRPLDLLVFSGDGSLDHHVLVAAFWAFCPELVRLHDGEVRVEPPSPEERAAVPAALRAAFFDPLPAADALPATEAAVMSFWVLRGRISAAVRAGRRPSAIARAAGRPVADPLLRLAVLATLLPHRVRARARGFDLSGLAEASREATFHGLYPFLRSIAVYPAGTAADNALYAGIPGYAYAQFAKVLRRPGLGWLRRAWGDRTRARFLKAFTQGVVVPARFAVVAFDGDWTALCSHAAGGPGGGSFFAPDLEHKTGGLWGYLARIPSVVWGEALFGSTAIRVTTRAAGGDVLQRSEGRMVEALYTNRAFIAGVGGVPSTNPTSFAGQSSLVLAPPLVYRDGDGRIALDASGVLTFAEAIGKGLLGRLMHGLGLGVGRLAGGGRFAMAAPEHQVTLQEGESVELEFLGADARGPERRRRAVATQISGDPYQAWRMQVRVAWGPLPLLASPGSLLMAAAQRALARLRVARSWRLQTVFIGGLPWFRHEARAGGEDTGLFTPPLTLPTRLTAAQRRLRQLWEGSGVGPFIDTTEQGVALGRRGRYAHNSDHTAHLALLRDGGGLLVRQVRHHNGHIYEGRASYRALLGAWVVHEVQVRRSDPGEAPVIVQEERYFRDAEAFLVEAPAFFPFLGEDRTWRPEDDAGAGRDRAR